MAILIDLPPLLEKALTVEAEKVGVSPLDRAAFLLPLMTAMTQEGRNPPFRSVVQAYLRRCEHDADRLTEVVQGLTDYCLRSEGPAPTPSDQTSADLTSPKARDDVASLLRGWRGPDVLRTVAAGFEPDVSTRELPQLAGPIRPKRPKKRGSILGKYAHLGLSTERFTEEKRLEVEREDRHR